MSPASLTGDEVKGLRESLGLNIADFAGLLGVHHYTVRRWEAYLETRPPIVQLQSSLLFEIRRRCRFVGNAEGRLAWGAQLREALLTGGTLEGLRALLEQSRKEKR